MQARLDGSKNKNKNVVVAENQDSVNVDIKVMEGNENLNVDILRREQKTIIYGLYCVYISFIFCQNAL